jgi:hypothetical protein
MPYISLHLHLLLLLCTPKSKLSLISLFIITVIVNIIILYSNLKLIQGYTPLVQQQTLTKIWNQYVKLGFWGGGGGGGGGRLKNESETFCQAIECDINF